MTDALEIFLIVPPGLEQALADEARAAAFEVTAIEPGGVTLGGDWAEVRRANMALRGATRVLVRLAGFPAVHLSQLDKRLRKLPWADWLRADMPVRVEASCRRSKIYHDRAAAQRLAGAITDLAGAPVAADGAVTLKLRIDRNFCTLSVDSSGDPLHRRGHKPQVNKAPMRETLAALFLRQCGYAGQMPVYDPMCGSGTFVIEAAEIAMGLWPGRARRFALDALACGAGDPPQPPEPVAPAHRFFGTDRDTGAITMSQANAARAGVDGCATFRHCAISDAEPPCETPGLVVANAPYGGRIGNKKPLYALYAAFGEVMRARFAGWRVGLITSDAGLARATQLGFADPGRSVDHGGIPIRLWQARV